MRFAEIISVAAATSIAGVVAQTTGQKGDAPIINGNPTGVAYKATLPDTPFFKAGALNGNVKGSVTGKTASNGVGIEFSVDFSNLPKEGGPFIYHIHAKPVPADGNCTATGAHLDPYVRGEDPVCDAKAPQTCQTGDLSGKHGSVAVSEDPYKKLYVDQYVASRSNDPSFFGNLSIVFHFANKTRITCANFVQIASNGTGSAYPTGVAPPTPTYSVPIVTAGASLAKAAEALKFAAAPLAALLFL